MPREKLIIFLKAPRPGTVKTRLASVIGAQAAAHAYTVLVETVVCHLACLKNVELRFAPDNARREVRAWLRPRWTARPQGRGDLGARMRRAFAESFAGGSERVVIIGSDCPFVTVRDVERAWSALRNCDLVIGPATDGGYWLIGLGRSQRGLFRNIAWSTEKVLAQTRARAESMGLRARLLRERTDIDTIAEWEAFCRDR